MLLFCASNNLQLPSLSPTIDTPTSWRSFPKLIYHGPPHHTKANCYLKYKKPKVQENSVNSVGSDDEWLFGARVVHWRINSLVLHCGVWFLSVHRYKCHHCAHTNSTSFEGNYLKSAHRPHFCSSQSCQRHWWTPKSFGIREVSLLHY